VAVIVQKGEMEGEREGDLRKQADSRDRQSGHIVKHSDASQPRPAATVAVLFRRDPVHEWRGTVWVRALLMQAARENGSLEPPIDPGRVSALAL
jgi:hypothetical protein